MLGIDDPGIYLVYLLIIASAALCDRYGIASWNQGAENEEQEISEEIKWETKEKELDQNL